MPMERAEIITLNETGCPRFPNKLGEVNFVLTNLLEINSKHVRNEITIVQNVELQSRRIQVWIAKCR